jgi:hypothetical protein
MEVSRWKISDSARVYALTILLSGAALLGVALFGFWLPLLWVVTLLGVVALLYPLSRKSRLLKDLLAMLLFAGLAGVAFVVLSLTKHGRPCEPATISTVMAMASRAE